MRPKPAARLFTRYAATALFLLLSGLALALPMTRPVLAGTLVVHVEDARTGLPIDGAFVQVGTAPGTPFGGNWGRTGPDGSILFSDPLLIGPQTVTAGVESMAYLTVFEAAEGSITLSLHPSVASATIPEPKAEIGGTVNGISTQSNDGNLDVGLVFPAVRLSDILASRSLPIEMPADTVSFPLVGEVVLPGNVVIPTQTELLFLTFSKPHYHFFVRDNGTYDFLVLAGRLPLTALGTPGLPMNLISMREIGAERNIPVHGNLTLNLNSDLNLQRTLTVQVPEAPAGTEVFASAVADLPWSGSTRSLFFDGKSALRDTLSALVLSGMNPTGDLIDVTPYVAGYYADTSSADRYQAGRVDRTALSLPATRVLGGFYRIPDLTQSTDLYQWTDVARPGITPDPTWAIASFRVDAQAPGDSTVTPRTVWEAWVQADSRSLRLPVLPFGAPAGLPDPNRTPEADQLLWDLWVADPAGDISAVMEDAFASLTTWSRRTVPIDYPTVESEEIALGTLSGTGLKFRLAPNPGAAVPDILWQMPIGPGEQVAWSILDPSGRQRASGRFTASGTPWERRVLATEKLPAGVYWVRLLAGERFGSVPLIITR